MAALQLLFPHELLIAGGSGDEPGATYLSEQLAGYEELAKARKLCADERWDRAAEIYQGAVDRLGRSLIAEQALLSGPPASTQPAVPDPTVAGGMQRFVALPEIVFAEISGGAPELLSAYRRRYEPAARQLLSQSSSHADRVVAAERYFPTQAAATALDEYGESLMESGQFAAARRVFRRLASRHPDRGEHGPYWCAKAALCDLWLGDDAAFDAAIGLLRRAEPTQDVQWGGRTMSAAAFLERERQDIAASRPARRNVASVAICAGPAGSGLRLPHGAMPEARLWRFSDFRPTTAANVPSDDLSDDRLDDAVRHSLGTGRHLGLAPAAANGRLFVSDRRNVWAVDMAQPEKALWHFWSGPATGDSMDADWTAEDEAPAVYTVAAEGDAVYAPLDPPAPRPSDDRSADSSMLVCLEAATGRLRWRTDMQELGNRFDEYKLDGAPLLYDGRAYVVARQRKPFGFEACHLVCCALQTGRILWHTHLGEAATGGYGFNRPTRTFPAAADGRVFVHTNIGTVAALDAQSGRVEWLWRYPTVAGDGAGAMPPGRAAAEIRPWQYNPTIVWRNWVIAAPLDSLHVFVFNADDGQLVRTLLLDQDLASADSLLGIIDGRLYAAGRWVACFDLAAGRQAWKRQLPAGQPFGRGALTAEGVYVPTDAALLRYPLDGGSPRSLPWSWRWAGNVLALPDVLVISSGHLLCGLVQREAALSRLQEQMRAAPDDPRPALAMADLEFETREFASALRAMDEAVRRARHAKTAGDLQNNSQPDGTLAARIFRRCMDGAELLSWDERAADRAARRGDALKLLEYAASFAPDSESEIRYRLKRATILLAERRAAEAVDVYQELLADPHLAAHAVPLAGLGDVVVGAYARDEIERLIREHGAAAYEKTQRAAAEALGSAADRRDVAALSEVARRFPNSPAAPQALIARARLQLADGRAADAVRSLFRALEFRGAEHRPAAFQLLADALRAGHREADARRVLSRAAAELPDARVEHDGRRISFAALRASFADKSAPAAGAPKVTYPLSAGWSREFPAVPSLLEPLLVSFDTGWDSILVHVGNRLEMLDAPTGAPRWPQPIAWRERPMLIAQTAGMAILATRHQICGVRLQSGQIAWALGANGEAADRPEVDPESVPQWIAYAESDGHVLAANSRSELFSLRAADGRIDWRLGDDAHKVGTKLVADDRYVAYVAWEDRQNLVIVIDAATGRVLGALRLAAERPLLSIRFAADGGLLALSATTVHLIDAEANAVLWNRSLDGRLISSSVCLSDEALYASTDGQTLLRLNIADGRIDWTSEALASGPAEAVRVEACDEAVIAIAGDQLCALDPRNGDILWRKTLPAAPDLFGPMVLGDDVLVAQSLAAASAPSSRPGQRAVSADSRPESEPPMIALQRVSTRNGHVQPISAAGGDNTRLTVGRIDAAVSRDRAVIVRQGHVISAFVGP